MCVTFEILMGLCAFFVLKGFVFVNGVLLIVVSIEECLFDV